MPVPKSDLPQGTLDLLILKIVALTPLHGYAIAQRLQQMSRSVIQVNQGSLYPALHRLENRGLLSAEWKTSDTGRESKIYRLTGRCGTDRDLCLLSLIQPQPAADGDLDRRVIVILALQHQRSCRIQRWLRHEARDGSAMRLRGVHQKGMAE